MEKNLSLGAIVILAAVAPASAISLASSNNFDTGLEGWVEGSRSNNPPQQSSDLGPDGQPGILVNSSDGSGVGGRYLMWNQSADWTGDYLSAGVTGIQVSVDNRSGLTSSLDLRAGFDGPGGWFVTEAFNLTDSTEGADWTVLNFDLTNLTGITGTGSGVLADTLGAVSNFEVFLGSSTNLPSEGGGGVLRGQSVNATLAFDDFQVIPEPSSILLSGFGLALLLRRRRG